MNKYDIKDKKTGTITHGYIAPSAHPHHPGWGELERFKWEDEATVTEKADAIATNSIEYQPGLMRTRLTLPQTYDVIITDLTADEATEATRITQVKTLKQRVKSLAGQTDLTAAELKEAVMKLIKAMVLDKNLE